MILTLLLKCFHNFVGTWNAQKCHTICKNQFNTLLLEVYIEAYLRGQYNNLPEITL